MKFDEQELRRQYAQLSDEALLATNRDELVEAARKVYDAELEERGLHKAAAAEATEVPGAPATPPGEALAEAAVYYTVEEARIARQLLRSAEIPCDIANEPNWAIDGIKLLVPKSMLEDAKAVLNTEMTEEELAQQAVAAGDPEAVEEAREGTPDEIEEP
jgi:hypothetical protein